MIINRLAAAKKTLLLLKNHQGVESEEYYKNALEIITHYYKTGRIKFAVLPMKSFK